MAGEDFGFTRPEDVCVGDSDRLQFLDTVRRRAHLGYGWMMQLIELEWANFQRLSPPPEPTVVWGPQQFVREKARLEAEIARLRLALETGGSR